MRQKVNKVLKTYIGIISVDGEEFTAYEIKALTYKSAKHRLKSICKRLSTLSNDEYYIEAFGLSNSIEPDMLSIIEKKYVTA